MESCSDETLGEKPNSYASEDHVPLEGPINPKPMPDDFINNKGKVEIALGGASKDESKEFVRGRASKDKSKKFVRGRARKYNVDERHQFDVFFGLCEKDPAALQFYRRTSPLTIDHVMDYFAERRRSSSKSSFNEPNEEFVKDSFDSLVNDDKQADVSGKPAAFGQGHSEEANEVSDNSQRIGQLITSEVAAATESKNASDHVDTSDKTEAATADTNLRPERVRYRLRRRRSPTKVSNEEDSAVTHRKEKQRQSSSKSSFNEPNEEFIEDFFNSLDNDDKPADVSGKPAAFGQGHYEEANEVSDNPQRIGQLITSEVPAATESKNALHQENREFHIPSVTRTIAAAILTVQAISFLLSVIGKDNWIFLLPSFPLSGFGFALSIYAYINEETDHAAIQTHATVQLEETDIVLSAVQLIVTFIQFILADWDVKSTTVSAFSLAICAIILLKRPLRKNRDNSSSRRGSFFNIKQCLNSVLDVNPGIIDVFGVPSAVLQEASEQAIGVSNDPRDVVTLKTTESINATQENQEFQVRSLIRAIPVAILTFQAIAFLLDVIGKDNWIFLLPPFLLSVLGFALSIYAYIKEEIDHAAIQTHATVQLEETDIIFSAVQLIVTFIQFILAHLDVKSTTVSALSQAVCAIILLERAFQKNRDNSSSRRVSFFNIRQWLNSALVVKPGFIDDQSDVPGLPSAVLEEHHEKAIGVSNDPPEIVTPKTKDIPFPSEVLVAVKSENASDQIDKPEATKEEIYDSAADKNLKSERFKQPNLRRRVPAKVSRQSEDATVTHQREGKLEKAARFFVARWVLKYKNYSVLSGTWSSLRAFSQNVRECLRKKTNINGDDPDHRLPTVSPAVESVARKKKRFVISVILVVLEAMSLILEAMPLILELRHKDKLKFLIGSFSLAMFCFSLTVWDYWKEKPHAANKTEAEKIIGMIEICFTTWQLIISSIDLITTALHKKSPDIPAVFPLLFGIIIIYYNSPQRVPARNNFPFNTTRATTRARGDEANPVNPAPILSGEPIAVEKVCSEQATKAHNDSRSMARSNTVPSTFKGRAAIENKNVSVGHLGTDSRLTSHGELTDRRASQHQLQDDRDVASAHEFEADKEEISEPNKTSDDFQEHSNETNVRAGSDDGIVGAT